MKIDLPLLNSKPRSCGTCTRCCEGYLVANIRGHEMKLGTPCYFLQQGVGCKEYDGRPSHPCKSFSCSWLDDKKIPEEYKPEKCGVILMPSDIHGIAYTLFVSSPNDPSEEMIQWAKTYFKKKKQNFIYTFEDAVYPVGTVEFVRMIRTHKDEFIKRKK